MAGMSTVTSVTLPSHLYPNIETRINDNSIRTYTKSTEGNCKMLAVSLTPKGKDRQIVTVDKGIDQYDELFGVGPCSLYGQAHLNARAAASTGKVTLQVLRLTAPDATYSNLFVYMHYRVCNEDGTVDVVSTPVEGQDEENPSTDEKPKKIQVMFTTESIKNLTNISDIEKLAPSIDEVNKKVNGMYTSDTDSDPTNKKYGGWTTVLLMSIAYLGRGTCGNNISFSITNHSRADKTSAYKNYFMHVFESSIAKEEARVTLYPDALIGSRSLYIENVVNDDGTGNGSNLIQINVNHDVLPTIWQLYLEHVVGKGQTALTEKTFDMILGVNKSITSARQDFNAVPVIPGYEIVQSPDASAVSSMSFNTTYGTKLENGNDGVFSATDPQGTASKTEWEEKRQKAVDQAFISAFSTTEPTDRKILSKYRCPLDFALDAGFSTEVKTALAQYTKFRAQDFRTYFDFGTDIDSLTDPYTEAATYEDIISGYTMSIDAYYGKIQDPCNKKVIRVTSTYNLAINLPLHWDKYGGKHIPYAGPKYAIIDAYIKNSIYPVYDDSIDQDILDKLVDVHVNYAAIDPKGNVVRATQTSRYNGLASDVAFAASEEYTVSNLSEENNVLIALDIKKDVEKLVCTYEYNFNEISEISSFNRDLKTLTNRYAAAQVHSITAKFERTTEEAELGVLHLYIAVENKPLIKYIQVDIDINRLSDD